MRLDGDYFPESKFRGGLLGSLPECLTLLRAVDAAETDTFRTLVVQDFEGIAVKNTGHWAIKFRSTGSGGAGGKQGAT